MCVLKLIYVTYIPTYVYIRINIHIYIYIHTYISVYVVMLYSAIFTPIPRIIIYFDHFRYSKDKDVGMQMKPYIFPLKNGIFVSLPGRQMNTLHTKN